MSKEHQLVGVVTRPLTEGLNKQWVGPKKPIKFICFIYCVVLNVNSFSFDTAAEAAAKSLQSCPTLCDPMDGSPPGTPIPGILQARTLEWVVIAFKEKTPTYEA